MIQQTQPLSGISAAIGVQIIETPRFVFRATWTRQGLYEFRFFGKPTEGRRLNGSIERGIQRRLEANSAEVALENEQQLWIRNAPGRIAKLTKQLNESALQYFRTGRFEWSLRDLDWEGISPFQHAVLRACHGIPTGNVMTYGQLAAKAGSPKAARAVGGAMAKNRWPLIIPCHRVVGSSGKLTGYSGMDGIETKQSLLEWEAAAFT